jgi:hypothetical protein
MSETRSFVTSEPHGNALEATIRHLTATVEALRSEEHTSELQSL